MSGIYFLTLIPKGEARAADILLIGMGDETAEPVAEILGLQGRDIHDHFQSLRDKGQRDAFIYGVLKGMGVSMDSRMLRLPPAEAEGA